MACCIPKVAIRCLFFNALTRLKTVGQVRSEQPKVVLRASGWEPRYQQEIDRLGIADIVTLAPSIGNREALVEQATADGLLLFQGSKFDRQMPAKCTSTCVSDGRSSR